MSNTQKISILFSDMMDALANVQRRKLFLTLLEHNPQTDPPVVIADSVDGTNNSNILISMHHSHLPKLAGLGFIEWDRERLEVERGPNFDKIRPLLELLDDHEDDLPVDWV